MSIVLVDLMKAISNIFYMALHVINSGSFPRPLPPEEERRCLERYHLYGDINARNKLIEHNLRLVAHIIKKYYSNVRDQDDLISIGTIGLIKAVNTFDYSKGARLATYASRCIENAIITLCTHVYVLIYRLKKFLIFFLGGPLQKDMNFIFAIIIK